MMTSTLSFPGMRIIFKELAVSKRRILREVDSWFKNHESVVLVSLLAGGRYSTSFVYGYVVGRHAF